MPKMKFLRLFVNLNNLKISCFLVLGGSEEVLIWLFGPSRQKGQGLGRRNHSSAFFYISVPSGSLVLPLSCNGTFDS